MTHGNIAIFIPHMGCPHACSFCDQRSISGTPQPVTPEDAAALLEEAFRKEPDPAHTEIAFFGGSFTCLPETEIEAFLKVAFPYVKEKACTGIRVSTRPDGLSPRVLELLKQYGVTAVELGAQSMDDAVLRLNRRGHTAEDVRKACAAVRTEFSLGLQVMAGLPGENRKSFDRTMGEVCNLKPDTLRIYPTVVLRGTDLERMTRENLYAPLTVEEAVEWVAPWIPRLEQTRIKVIRVGLHASRSVEERLIGGAYHPAFRELCDGWLYRRLMKQELEKCPPGAAVTFLVSPRELSKAAGQKRANLVWAAENGYQVKLQPDPTTQPGTLQILL